MKTSDYLRTLLEIQDLEQKITLSVAKIMELEVGKCNMQDMHTLWQIEEDLHKYTERIRTYIGQKIEESVKLTGKTDSSEE